MPTSTTVRLLNAWKAHTGITSDNQAALRLGLTRQTVSGWRTEINHANPIAAEKMALPLNLDVCGVLSAIEADRATNEATRRVWRRYGTHGLPG